MPVSNSCDCPNPPGGRVVCEPDQIAICIVKDGVALQQCHNPPSATSATAIVNWTLTEITGVLHAADAKVDLPALQMLMAGTFDRESGEKVTFSCPESVRQAIQTKMAELNVQRSEAKSYRYS